MLAAIHALMNDDQENAMVALAPGGIEAQERTGQIAFVANETLPIELGSNTQEQAEQMGIVYGEPVDDLFVQVQLPEGWCKVATDHSMHSEPRDDQGRIRARIFYKAAFYDRRADMSLVRRYTFGTEPVGGYGAEGFDQAPYYGYVKDQATGEIVWKTEHVVERVPDDAPQKVFLAFYDAKGNLTTLAKEWLVENYPDWKDPLAYWD